MPIANVQCALTIISETLKTITAIRMLNGFTMNMKQGIYYDEQSLGLINYIDVLN